MSLTQRLSSNYDEPSDREAKITDIDNPDLHEQDFLCEVGEQSMFDGSESGLTYKTVLKVLECTNPRLVGKTYCCLISGLDGKDKDLKNRNLKEFHAACFNKSPADPERWRELAAFCVDKQANRGKLVRCKVGSPRAGKRNPGGRKFCEIKFRAA